jgi:hypothetical protein
MGTGSRFGSLARVGGLWLALGAAAQALELTAVERTWLEAALPVLQFARSQQLPLDVIVQPQPTPGQTPLGMGFVDGRCKLVLSMRGNPDAQALLDRIEPTLRGPVLEAIAAHELGHCWRHVSGRWGTLPVSLHDATAFHRVSAEHAELLREMWRTRREEAFADLVGLAWTLQRHPTRYAEVHAWHVRLRADQDLETGPHDTRTWVRLAADPTRFLRDLPLFEQVHSLWVAGMLDRGAADTPQRSAALEPSANH